MKSLSIVVPTYNSNRPTSRDLGIVNTVSKLVEFLEQNAQYYEIIVVDDGSTDTTSEAIKSLCNRYINVRGIVLKENVGQQNATLAGLRACRLFPICILDDDLNYDLVDILNLYSALDQLKSTMQAVVYLKPNKREDHRPFYRNLGTLVKEGVFQCLLKKPPHIQLTSNRIINKGAWQYLCEDTSKTVYLSARSLSARSLSARSLSARSLMEPIQLDQIASMHHYDHERPTGNNTRYSFIKLIKVLVAAVVHYGPFCNLLPKRQGKQYEVCHTYGFEKEVQSE